MRSTRWPGATTVAYNDKFANIYVGDGLKDLGNSKYFSITKLPVIQKEYAIGEGAIGNTEELNEQNDPTLAEEVAFEEDKKAGENEGKEEGEENAEEEQDE